MNIMELLGAMMQPGVNSAAGQRLQHTLGSSGSGSSEGLLSSLFGGGGSGGGIGGMLGDILQEAGQAVGGKKNLAVGGIGALAGALLGGGKRSMGGAVGGGLMALLGALAFSALKKAGQPQAEVPLGLRTPAEPQEEKRLEENAGLVLQAMINAAKADGEIDQGEVQRIVGKLSEMGIAEEAKAFLNVEMQKPMDTETLIRAGAGRPELAAQLYIASLLAIKVDTPAEEAYVRNLGEGLGLQPEVMKHLEAAVGLNR
ncbi:conserved hypothetical protein [uncultured Desulfatiglans sp.]|nr:conserved hypothetical protein [uncultured Desulfatiglans sp.]